MTDTSVNYRTQLLDILYAYNYIQDFYKNPNTLDINRFIKGLTSIVNHDEIYVTINSIKICNILSRLQSDEYSENIEDLKEYIGDLRTHYLNSSQTFDLIFESREESVRIGLKPKMFANRTIDEFDDFFKHDKKIFSELIFDGKVKEENFDRKKLIKTASSASKFLNLYPEIISGDEIIYNGVTEILNKYYSNNKKHILNRKNNN